MDASPPKIPKSSNKKKRFLEQQLLNYNNFTILSISLLKSNSRKPRIPFLNLEDANYEIFKRPTLQS